MKAITLDYSNVMDFVNDRDIVFYRDRMDSARERVLNRSGEGKEFLGWVNLPDEIDSHLIDDIKRTAEKIRKESDVFITIGIGGSYLGARACIEALLPEHHNQLEKPELYFIGTSISPRQMNDLLRIIKGRKVTVNVISKSGTTTEPALAFRVIRDWMVSEYGRDEAYRRIIATTDAEKGALRQLADSEGLKTYIIPDDIGGRFSVLTPVGLLPIAVAGIDISKLVEGARDGVREYRDIDDIVRNPSLMYALLRNVLYDKGKTTEILANFEPQIHYISEWWKQLFGESEGKDHKGIFPASVDFTTDLHSMGQWIQDGRRDIFETFINIEDPGAEVIINEDPDNLDKLNYLTGKTFTYVNHQALQGTRAAHLSGGVPNMTINMPDFSPYSLGKLFYFFEWAVAISSYMLGVNPFNQPGVEDYKKNMFALLGKPGSEEETKKIKKELSGRKQFLSTPEKVPGRK
jgi:glucose-6-phosphate isomerase